MACALFSRLTRKVLLIRVRFHIKCQRDLAPAGERIGEMIREARDALLPEEEAGIDLKGHGEDEE